MIKSILSIFEKDWHWSNRSCRSLKKINRHQINHVNLWKRSTGSNRSCQLLKQINGIVRSFLRSNQSFKHKNNRFNKKAYFHMFLNVFPLFMAKDWIAPVNFRSFLKIDRIVWLSWIFEKYWHDPIDSPPPPHTHTHPDIPEWEQGLTAVPVLSSYYFVFWHQLHFKSSFWHSTVLKSPFLTAATERQ